MSNYMKEIKNTKLLQSNYVLLGFILNIISLTIFTVFTGHLIFFTFAKQQNENANFLLKHKFSRGQ